MKRLFTFVYLLVGCRLLKTGLLPLTAMAALLLPISGQASESMERDVSMYRNEDRRRPVSLFSPKDKIVVRIKLKKIPKGFHTFYADWYNANGDLQEKNSYRFSTSKETNKIIESSLEIKKASPLKRLFSASEATGYNIKFYGKWQVKLYLNGEKIAYKEFEVR
jgi:hypothetical protein